MCVPNVFLNSMLIERITLKNNVHPHVLKDIILMKNHISVSLANMDVKHVQIIVHA